MSITFSGIVSLIAKSGQTFHLNKSVYIINSMGAREYSNTPVGSPISCWFQSSTDNDRERFGQRGIKVSHKCYFSADPGAREGDTGEAGGDVGIALKGRSLVVRGFDNQGGLDKLVVLFLEVQKDG